MTNAEPQPETTMFATIKNLLTKAAELALCIMDPAGNLTDDE